jgi:hypothetical protein
MKKQWSLAVILAACLECAATAAAANCSDVVIPAWALRLFDSRDVACVWAQLAIFDPAGWEKEYPQLETPGDRVWFVIAGVDDIASSRTVVFAMAKKVTGEVVVAYRVTRPSLRELISSAEEKGEALDNLKPEIWGRVLRSSGGPYGDRTLRSLARKLEKSSYKFWGPKNGWDDPIYGEFRPLYFLYFFGFFSEDGYPTVLSFVQGEQPELEKWIEEVIARRDKWEREFKARVFKAAEKKP